MVGIGLPQSKMGIVINLGDSQMWLNTKSNIPDAYDRYWIQGFMDNPMLVQTKGHYRMIGVKFRPAGCAPFFRFPISELSNNQLKADLVWGTAINTLREQLLHSNDTAEMFCYFEQFLMTQFLDFNTTAHEVVRYSIQKIEASVPISQLVQCTGYSRKHLTHLFKNTLGIVPKNYERRLRFSQALDSLYFNKANSLTDLAYELNYFDQAHFIKDFQSLAGIAPNAYRKAKKANASFIKMSAI